MHGGHRVALGEIKRGAHPLDVEPLEMRQQRVDHRVADEVDPPGRRPGGDEVVDTLGACHEQELREEVRDPPVDLLGHRVVEGSKAGLDVGHRQIDLRRHERRGNGRIDVAVDHRERRPDLRECPLEGHHDRGRLGGV